MRFVTLNDRKCILDKENGATYCFINIRDMRNCCKLLTQLDDERKSLNQDLNKQFLLGSNGYNPFRNFEHRNKKALNGDGFLMFLRKQGGRDVQLTSLDIQRNLDTHHSMFFEAPIVCERGVDIDLNFKIPLFNVDKRTYTILMNEYGGQGLSP